MSLRTEGKLPMRRRSRTERAHKENPRRVDRDSSPDAMTPRQYYDTIARPRVREGEERLRFAVLEDAIRCFALAAASPAASRGSEFLEVQAWVNTRGERDVFSFDSICEAFEIEPELLRRRLNTMRFAPMPTRRIRSVGRRTPLRVPD